MTTKHPNTHAADEVFLDVGQTAMRWHVTKETVRRKIRRGEIVVIRPCRHILIPLSEVERIERKGGVI
ncbi:MAG: helix-turn-helix domain-containing protein [Verrucomicrobia bacterium]|jgi:excisionase family DNA binding protein|nr:helix-turn-helix domain-containing protein [Verrucomicrobiota bacterium]